MKSPNKTKIRITIFEETDDSNKNAVRKKIHKFLFRRQIPTIKKILVSVSEDPDLPNFSRQTLYRLIKDIHFEFCKRGRNSRIIERSEIIIWQNEYLKKVREYHTEGQNYLDESWVNPRGVSSKSSELITL